MRLLIDLQTGEPTLDLEGDLEEIDIDRAFNQYLDCLLHTPIFEEVLAPTWGIDVQGIIEASGTPQWETVIKFLIADALDSQKEPLISSVEKIELSRDDEELSVNLHVKSKYGTSAELVTNINV